MYRKIRRALGTGYRLTRPVFDPFRLAGIPAYIRFFRDLRTYRKLDGAHSVKLRDLHPLIYQKTNVHGIIPHYFYQAAWATRLILASGAKHHVDVGSETNYVGMLSAMVEVTFIDLRELDVNLDNFHSKAGTVLALPYPDRSLVSLSSLHVIEHIGLGRYGDPIDPEGTKKAARELVRVVAPGGNLYVSLPIGEERVCFNAHRIHSTSNILELFQGLELVEFSAVSDDGKFHKNSDLNGFDEARYSCGLFWFRVPEDDPGREKIDK